jgi:transcriptional regulator with GAF, ATPase, and Fis domain
LLSRAGAEVTPPTVDIIGTSAEIAELRARALQIAQSNVKVLICGESGVGKDLFARFIHAHSTRAHRPFVAINCASVSDTLLESELFGHVKGSFTGAYRDKPGRLQLADGGTLFMDEVGEMSPRMQALLLRFLENGEIQPVGSDLPRRTVDVRVITATNRQLVEMVATGAFRIDLFYRIRIAQFTVPALRERVEDIPVLIEHFFRRHSHTIHFTDEALRALQSYAWPGNVRELLSVVEELGWTAVSSPVDVGDLPASIRTQPSVPMRGERRRLPGSVLFERLVAGTATFWADVHQQFLKRDITRNDLREVVRRGLSATHGNYRGLLPLFGLPDDDYKRLLNFLRAHECLPDFREFRGRSGTPRAGDARAPDDESWPNDRKIGD